MFTKDILLYKIIIVLSIIGLVLPSFCLAQEQARQIPQTVEEAKGFGMKILTALPGAVKKVWQEEALPFLLKMWAWTQPKIEPWRQKFLDLLGKETPDIKKEFQKEKQEMQSDLWQRFKDLLE